MRGVAGSRSTPLPTSPLVRGEKRERPLRRARRMTVAASDTDAAAKALREAGADETGLLVKRG